MQGNISSALRLDKERKKNADFSKQFESQTINGGILQRTEQKSKQQHDPASGTRCRCGCVPNVMSLFEMAALRAQKRKEREKLKQQQNQEEK